MDFKQTAPVLEATGMAEASDEPLDIEELSRDLEIPRDSLRAIQAEAERAGLALAVPDEPPLLTRAGRQYLALKGEIADATLFFLGHSIDDLHARNALIHGGTVLVDEFRCALAHGTGVEHAASLVPSAFARAVDDRLALDLFAAAVALMARLSCGRAAGCVAEEVMAVALLDNAEVWLEIRCEQGEIDATESEAAHRALDGIFDLFGDSDVLEMFEMEEPADAALAGHSAINRMAGIADQRLEAWLEPFGGVTDTGHLCERPERR